MKRLPPLAATAALVLLSMSACSPAGAPPDAPIDTGANGGPALEAPAELNLGRAIAGTRVSGEFLVRATRPVRLLSVESSCECTTASAVGLPRDLRTGETLPIGVEMDLSKVGRGGLPKEGEAGPGSVRREIIVKTAQGEIRRAVLVEVSDGILLEPPSVSLGTIALGTTLRPSVRVRPTGSVASVAVLATESSEPSLVVTSVPEGNGARIDLEWTPGEVGTREAQVTLKLDQPTDPSATIRVMATVVAPVTVYPTSIENLSAPITQPVVVSLAVRRLDAEPLDLRSVTTDNHRVQVKIEPGEGPQRSVQVVVPVLASPAESIGTITIQTGVPGAESLTVPFRVRAAPPAGAPAGGPVER